MDKQFPLWLHWIFSSTFAGLSIGIACTARSPAILNGLLLGFSFGMIVWAIARGGNK